MLTLADTLLEPGRWNVGAFLAWLGVAVVSLFWCIYTVPDKVCDFRFEKAQYPLWD
jgi:hypothetical protein